MEKVWTSFSKSFVFVFIKSIINDCLLSASTLAPQPELFAQYTILMKKIDHQYKSITDNEIVHSQYTRG